MATKELKSKLETRSYRQHKDTSAIKSMFAFCQYLGKDNSRLKFSFVSILTDLNVIAKLFKIRQEKKSNIIAHSNFLFCSIYIKAFRGTHLVLCWSGGFLTAEFKKRLQYKSFSLILFSVKRRDKT